MDISKKQQLLQTVLDKAVDKRKVFGTSFALKTDHFSWHGVSGNFAAGQAYYIGSTTKLFTTALILLLKSQGRLNLDDKLLSFMPHAPLRDLHIYRGKNYSEQINLRQLLAHTSGLPDYFQDKLPSARSLQEELLSGKDRGWSFHDVMEMVKHLPPHFAPDTPGRAHYSDANFQLLGRVIELLTSMSFVACCEKYIIQPLGLTHTRLCTDGNDTGAKTMYYKKRELPLPRAMASFGADGGMISTAEDMLVFIEAFFTGKIFPREYISELQVWNQIFYPMSSGVGIHLFKLPWIFNPTGAVPPFMGHSGLSGALAFYCPVSNCYFSGTVNQIANPDISFRTMIKLYQVLMKK
jgi:CubicO group peptidase (beta-lactamase class C family)